MVHMTIANLKEGLVLAEPVQAHGRILLAAGASLTQSHLRIFKTWGVVQAAIEGDALEAEGKEGFEMDPEELHCISMEIDKRFEKCNSEDEVMSALKKAVLKRAVERHMEKAA